MNDLSRAVLLVVALTVGGCASSGESPMSSSAQEYKASLHAPADRARVYLLPTYSKGLFLDLDGAASFAIFPDGSDRGAKLGQTTKAGFLAFDIGPGDYDLLAYGDDPLTKVSRPVTFAAGKTYFLRPAFFRSAKEVTADPAASGKGFDVVAEEAAAEEIQKLAPLAVARDGEAFLKRTLMVKAAAPVAPAAAVVPAAAAAPSVAAGMPSAPPAEGAKPTVGAADGSGFAVVERKLRELKRLRQEGLITQQDYDAKRRDILNAY